MSEDALSVEGTPSNGLGGLGAGEPTPERFPGLTEPLPGGSGGALRFTVLGQAVPGGSKKVFLNPKTGAPIVTDDSGKRGKHWRRDVQGAALDAKPVGSELLLGPLGLELVFFRERPLSHYGTGRNADTIRGGADPFPLTRPDVLKLARAVEDALSGIVYRDDAQIVEEVLRKRWGSPARCEVVLWTL